MNKEDLFISLAFYRLKWYGSLEQILNCVSLLAASSVRLATCILGSCTSLIPSKERLSAKIPLEE